MSRARRRGLLRPGVRRAVEEFVREARRRADGSIERILLFGSQARGEAGTGSDVDIIVVWRGERWTGWKTIADVAFKAGLNHGVYISAKVFTPGEVSRMIELGLPFVRNILREGREL